MSSIWIGLIVLSIAIVWLGVSVLNRCNKILSAVEWFQQRFMSKSPGTDKAWHRDLAEELFSIKEQLAPLSFLPLADIAVEIKRMGDDVAEAFDKTLEDWERIEQKEMEDLAATNPPDGKAFIASDNLKYALRAWAIERYKKNVVEEWTNLLKDVYRDLLNARIGIGEAEEKLNFVSSFELSFRAKVDPKVQEIINGYASNWEGEKWRNRLDFLQGRVILKEDLEEAPERDE
jgi:hypothetical protein